MDSAGSFGLVRDSIYSLEKGFTYKWARGQAYLSALTTLINKNSAWYKPASSCTRSGLGWISQISSLKGLSRTGTGCLRKSPPLKCSTNVWMQHLRTRFAGEHNGAVLTTGLWDLKGLFQPQHYHDPMKWPREWHEPLTEPSSRYFPEESLAKNYAFDLTRLLLILVRQISLCYISLLNRGFGVSPKKCVITSLHSYSTWQSVSSFSDGQILSQTSAKRKWTYSTQPFEHSLLLKPEWMLHLISGPLINTAPAIISDWAKIKFIIGWMEPNSQERLG